MVDCVIADIDGTLVDSNYHHALAWYRAFRRIDVTIPLWQIHRAIGMGGDQLVAHVAGEQAEAEHGDSVRAAWAEEFQPLLPEISAFGDAVALLTDIKDRGLALVLASSAAPEHVDVYLDLVDGKRLADAWTTSADARETKPAPDLVKIALEKARARDALMIGDSPWDAQAASKVDVPTLAVRTGGFSESELRDAGASAVFSSLEELRNRLGEFITT